MNGHEGGQLNALDENLPQMAAWKATNYVNGGQGVYGAIQGHPCSEAIDFGQQGAYNASIEFFNSIKPLYVPCCDSEPNLTDFRRTNDSVARLPESSLQGSTYIPDPSL
jgi:hypothetical protein